MQQHHALIVEQRTALAEESIVVADTDMVEHPDGDDAIEFLHDVAIVLQPDFHPFRETLFGSPHARDRVLLLRKGDAGDACSAQLGEIERKSTPAAADVEHS